MMYTPPPAALRGAAGVTYRAAGKARLPLPTAADVPYLDPTVLAAVRGLDLRVRMVVEGVMTGQHRSPYQGFSVEFAQHRAYAPGDDIRHLDWKVFGRTDKLYLKQYQQETNLDLLLLVDVSGSMGFGSVADGKWTKFDHAATAAAALAHLALRQQDRVGLALFAQHIDMPLRLSNRHDHDRAIVNALASARLTPEPELNEQTAAARATNLTRSMEEVLAKMTQRSLLVVLSDLFDDPAALEKAVARVHHRRHDLLLMQVLDPQELEFPFRSASEFVGLEGEGRLPLDPPALRRAYLRALREHQQQIERMARAFQFDHLVLNTSQSLGPPLSHFLARRSARASRGA